MARRCLYYPFIHFRDEGWLKLSALYWDDVSRIVPRAYVPRDPREVRLLEDAGVVRRIDPTVYEPAVRGLFESLLERHQRRLVARYDVAARDRWPVNRERLALSTGRLTSSSLAFIHCTKLDRSLVAKLLELRLALPSRDRRWLGMHPRIVAAYMIALAAEIGRRRGLSPSSDSPVHLSAVSSCSVDELARSLISEMDLAKRRAPKLDSERVAFVTLRTVLPERLDGVPAKRIIQLREQHAAARHAFHGYVEEVQRQLASSGSLEQGAFEEHVRLEYERRLKPELAELARALRALGVGTFLGVVGVAITLPVGSQLGASPSTALAAGAGSALAVAALALRQRDAARALLKPSPASFLFSTAQLRHRSLGARVAQSVRRFSLGI